MALKHLPENPREEARAWNLQLGGPGFKYADLNRVRRLEALDAAFLAELHASEPELAADFRGYRDSGGKDRGNLPESEVLIKVAPHVGAFTAESVSRATRVAVDNLMAALETSMTDPAGPDTALTMAATASDSTMIERSCRTNAMRMTNSETSPEPTGTAMRIARMEVWRVPRRKGSAPKFC